MMANTEYVPPRCEFCSHGLGYGPEACHRCNAQRKRVKDAFSEAAHKCSCPDAVLSMVAVEDRCAGCGNIHRRYGMTMKELRKAILCPAP